MDLLFTDAVNAALENAPRLTWMGHASLKIVTSQGTVVYVDPYAPGDYSQAADLILASHEHHDHNEIALVTQKKDCVVLRAAQTIGADGTYRSFTVKDVRVEPVPAQNAKHDIRLTNGYLLEFDGLTVYFASDTGYLPFMETLRARGVDYALLPIDGVYTMTATEAARAARAIHARHVIPIHWFNADPATFDAPNALVLRPGETIVLEIR